MRPDICAATTENTAPRVLPVWSDTQLLARLAAGDQDAISPIYDRYAASIFRVLSALLHSPADAEDALQEVFVALATGRASKIRDLRSYLFVAARHQAFTVLRRRGRESSFEDISQLEIAAPETPDSPHDFAALLNRLPLQQREVIALKVWEGFTFAEIAPIVKASPNTVMSRYRYGIERLRIWCAEENLD
ncbi:RNA polymerase sigma factor [Abditibacterium utsteinense]|uniref:RNA polymerase sigma factor n=1 Tax=Abditibacterium utsteinense TaxID=1960156 RepID=UPI00147501AC|nr:RNA polymerase sigma factor [Abditibacterium utsteinense]